jgi:hypothetical protein
MSGWVTVTGPPRAICSRKIWITEPAEPRTLPKRTARSGCREAPVQVLDHQLGQRFVAPITELGRTALSVEIRTNASTPCSPASRPRDLGARTLLRTASPGLDSISGTCLWAAAWKTTSGTPCSNTARSRSSSPTSPTRGTIQVRATGAELAVDVEQRELRALVEQQVGGPEAGDLAGELGADRAAGAGDHHAAAGQEAFERLLVERTGSRPSRSSIWISRKRLIETLPWSTS